MTRRQFAALAAAAPAALSTLSGAPRTAVGVGSASYHYRASVERQRGETPITDPLRLASYCAELGAGGIQAALPSDDGDYARKVGDLLRKNGMYFEASVELPRGESDIDAFQRTVRAADQAGATVIRTVLFSGRRYESFTDAAQFQEARQAAWKSITLAEPVLRKRKIKLAIENHKDLRSEDLLQLIGRIQSEYVGVCVDLGNNYALMEDPIDIVRAFSKFAYSCHIKDHVLKSYNKGFLLFDAKLGTGVINLRQAVSTLRQAQPTLKFSLETMTRDALEVPYLEGSYWASMGNDIPGQDVVRTMKLVQDTEPKDELPRISALSPEEYIKLEDDNIRAGLAYAADTLGL
jgi:sugar phosphate isomerase/epimerase